MVPYEGFQKVGIQEPIRPLPKSLLIDIHVCCVLDLKVEWNSWLCKPNGIHAISMKFHLEMHISYKIYNLPIKIKINTSKKKKITLIIIKKKILPHDFVEKGKFTRGENLFCGVLKINLWLLVK